MSEERTKLNKITVKIDLDTHPDNMDFIHELEKGLDEVMENRGYFRAGTTKGDSLEIRYGR